MQRDYFIAPELVEQEMKKGEFKLPEGYNLVPHLFFYKVVEGNDYVPAPDPDFSIRIASNRNVYIDTIENMVGRCFLTGHIMKFSTEDLTEQKFIQRKFLTICRDSNYTRHYRMY
jgi:hypothetical protein